PWALQLAKVGSTNSTPLNQSLRDSSFSGSSRITTPVPTSPAALHLRSNRKNDPILYRPCALAVRPFAAVDVRARETQLFTRRPNADGGLPSSPSPPA